MQYRRFGRTNMLLSQISLGCMRFPGASPEDDENAIRTVERAVALGINHIETGAIRKPLWQHEGDLVARRLKQTPG